MAIERDRKPAIMQTPAFEEAKKGYADLLAKAGVNEFDIERQIQKLDTPLPRQRANQLIKLVSTLKGTIIAPAK